MGNRLSDLSRGGGDIQIFAFLRDKHHPTTKDNDSFCFAEAETNKCLI